MVSLAGVSSLLTGAVDVLMVAVPLTTAGVSMGSMALAPSSGAVDASMATVVGDATRGTGSGMDESEAAGLEGVWVGSFCLTRNTFAN
jgi:hypothetical protein